LLRADAVLPNFFNSIDPNRTFLPVA